MKCFKCKQGELEVVEENGKKYARCNNCGIALTANDLRTIMSQSQASEEKKGNGLKIGLTIGGIFLVLIVLVGAIAIIGSSDRLSESEKTIKQTKDDKADAPSVPTESASNKPTEDFEINIEQCVSDLKANLPLEPDYTFVRDYYIEEKDDNLTITAVVDDATAPDKALDFADTLVRQLNLYAHIQDNDIELGNADFYGGLYKKYSALVGVAPASQTDDPDNWFVYDAITGGQIKLKLNKKYR